jgi:hypothetical protein
MVVVQREITTSGMSENLRLSKDGIKLVHSTTRLMSRLIMFRSAELSRPVPWSWREVQQQVQVVDGAGVASAAELCLRWCVIVLRGCPMLPRPETGERLSLILKGLDRIQKAKHRQHAPDFVVRA